MKREEKLLTDAAELCRDIEQIARAVQLDNYANAAARAVAQLDALHAVVIPTDNTQAPA